MSRSTQLTDPTEAPKDHEAEQLHRTTVLLRLQDVENLKTISREQGTTDTEAIRRAIRLMREMLDWQMEGGSLVLEKGRARERIRFL
jgi:hypothetical protein